MKSVMLKNFKKVEMEIKKSIGHEESPLKQGLAVLTLAQTRFNVESLSTNEIVQLLDCMDVAGDEISLARAFARAGKKVSITNAGNMQKYKATITGQNEVKDLISIKGPEVIYVEGGKPRTVRKKLSEILSGTNGIVRICDPYYGVRTLSILEMFPKVTHVKFLTVKSNENAIQLSNAMSDFKKEYKNVEMRQYLNPSEIHDRYIISDKKLLIVGHGIKDIGNKESFIIHLDNSCAPDLIDTLEKTFDSRWNTAVPL